MLQPSDGLPMAYPGAIDVVYDTIGKQETFEVGARVLKARSTLVKGHCCIGRRAAPAVRVAG